jgi:hypothetical protein
MKFVADFCHSLLYRATRDFAFFDLAGPSTDDFLPLGFGISID